MTTILSTKNTAPMFQCFSMDFNVLYSNIFYHTGFINIQLNPVIKYKPLVKQKYLLCKMVTIFLIVVIKNGRPKTGNGFLPMGGGRVS